MTVEWADPPTEQRGRHPNADWMAVAAELRSQPGRWAKVAVSPTSALASRIKTAKLAAFRPAGSFDATLRSAPTDAATGARRYTIYARYVGYDAEPSFMNGRHEGDQS